MQTVANKGVVIPLALIATVTRYVDGPCMADQLSLTGLDMLSAGTGTSCIAV